ncbi:MAG: hypothetical protein M3O28_14880 [Actinomycetota bacterium]|nr:hypothetical protein [Actinomycetota bacterium]
MLHPTGPLPSSVYWRRRLALLFIVLLLGGLTVWVLRPGGSKPSASGPSVGPTPSNAALHTSAPPARPSTSGAATGTPASVAGSGAAKATVSAGPQRCLPANLQVSAVPAKTSYNVGDSPQLLMQVVNIGATPCVQDLADSQVELRVYNGESRVWGSHDCEIQPGSADRTLIAGQTVRVSVAWSGLSSQPGCAGTRQRVGAGTYNLYAFLSGHTGTAGQFSIG